MGRVRRHDPGSHPGPHVSDSRPPDSEPPDPADADPAGPADPMDSEAMPMPPAAAGLRAAIPIGDPGPLAKPRLHPARTPGTAPPPRGSTLPATNPLPATPTANTRFP